MVHIIVQLSKYLITLLMVLFTVQSFLALRERDEEERSYILGKQILMILLMDFICFFVMYLQEREFYIIRMFLYTLAYLLGVQAAYRILFRKASMILLNNMCMMLCIGLIILTRLRVSSAQSQFKIIVLSTVLSFIAIVIIRKVKILKDLTWLYGIAGILMIGAVLLLAVRTGGAQLSIQFGGEDGFTFQFSEFVKITLVFFMAGMLREDNSFRKVVVTTIVAAVHVLILVASTDLGTALVYFVAYVVVIYLATRKAAYPLLGLGGMAVACVMAYFLFSHVRTRVQVWRDPFQDYDAGYQVIQALFGLASGGWFGTGLFEGSPTSIPVATKDATFCAICEEMGLIFGICLILLCMSTFLLIVNISMKMNKRFYKLIAMGLGSEYAIQVFLTIGGITKFIPLTGITLPLVSYGGSSILCTILMLSIIQGLYILREDEGEALAKRNKQKQKKSKTVSKNNAGAEKRKNGDAGRKKTQPAVQGKPYFIVSFLFVGIFLSLIAYLVYFNVTKRETYLSDSHNTRQKDYAEKVVRGSILSSDGVVLARTDVDEDGNETRVYPYDNLFAHVVGYLSKGSSGLEATENYQLLESHANPLEQLRNEFKDEKNIGDNVITTLNSHMQQVAYDALGDNIGAVIALEPDTGRVLVSVSKPSFNPNTIDEDWDSLTADDSSGVFLNRGLQGQYPPGSTFKIVTALAYLRQNQTLDGCSFDCEGELTNGGCTIC